MKKQGVIKKRILDRHPRIKKVMLKRGATSLDGNLIAMVHLFESIENHTSKNPAKTKLRLEESRVAAINYLGHVSETHKLTDIQTQAVKRVINRLNNKFNKEGVMEAFNVTCNLGL
jgi:hypothetical protein